MDKNLKYFHFLILIYLLSIGAKDNPIEITSVQISRVIGKSQQTTSKGLIDLEMDGFIERLKNNRKFKIKVTAEGFEIVTTLYELIEKSLKQSRIKQVIFKGKIVSGMGEGSYYMSLNGYKKQFKEKLGYEPFPGTLNLRLEEKIYMDRKKELTNFPSIYIDRFKDENRTYGWVKCYPAFLTLENERNCDTYKDKVKDDTTLVNLTSAILALERTHHDNRLLEIISPYCIKETANVKNGDIVKIVLEIDNDQIS